MDSARGAARLYHSLTMQSHRNERPLNNTADSSLSKLEKLTFYVFLFSIPFQTRLILHKWTLPFNEWTAAFLYGTDILLVPVFIFWLARSIKNKSRLKLDLTGRLLIVFFTVSALSILNSKIIGLSFYHLLKLWEFLLLYFYIKTSFGRLYNFNTAALVVLSSGIFQSVIAIGQYLKQANLGLKIFGESPLSVDITNVAVIITDGQKYLRAYGTTPHPNVLAAWLLAGLFAFYCLVSRQNRPAHSKVQPWFWLGYTVLLFAFFLTFSRVIISLWGLAFIIGWLARPNFAKQNLGGLARRKEKITKQIAAITMTVTMLFTVTFWPQVQSRLQLSLQDEAVSQRLQYNQIATQTIKNGPLLGIGIGQFVADLMAKYKHYPALFYQPAHNIYLLIASETGLIGLGLFSAFLFSIFWRIRRDPFWLTAYSLLLIAGLFDHFLWTLQPGSLIFWLVMALASVRGVDSRLVV